MHRHARVVRGRLPGRLSEHELAVVRDVLFEKATSLDEMDEDDVPAGRELADMRDAAAQLRTVAFRAVDLIEGDPLGDHHGRNR